LKISQKRKKTVKSSVFFCAFRICAWKKLHKNIGEIDPKMMMAPKKKNLQLWRRGRTPSRRAAASACPFGPLSERSKDIPLVHHGDEEARVTSQTIFLILKRM
jgi:hypothetical protein